MKNLQKTGLAMGLLLIPVFLYLLVSLPSKPVANVSDEFHYLVDELDVSMLSGKESIIILSDQFVLDDVIWFDEVFDKFGCYQILGSLPLLNFTKDDIVKNKLPLVDIDSLLVVKTSDHVSQFGEGITAILVDDHAFLRGVYNFNDQKERERLKTELVILITNQSECQKKY